MLSFDPQILGQVNRIGLGNKDPYSTDRLSDRVEEGLFYHNHKEEVGVSYHSRNLEALVYHTRMEVVDLSYRSYRRVVEDPAYHSHTLVVPSGEGLCSLGKELSSHTHVTAEYSMGHYHKGLSYY